MGNEINKPDFTDIRTSVETTAKEAPDAKPDFSDVQSKVSSTVDESTIYEVQSGDSLSKIAKEFYGDGSDWKGIFDANRDQLSDPDRIKPGQMLTIPVKL